METYASTHSPSTSPPSSATKAHGERLIAPNSFEVKEANRLQPTLEKPDFFTTLTSSNANVNESARLFTNPFDETSMAINGDNPLYKSLAGRLLTQTVSRGIFAAAFFTAGSYIVSKQWNPGAGYDDANQPLLGKPLEALSDIFDFVLTKPTQFVLQHGLGMDAEAAKQLLTFNQYAINEHVIKQAGDAQALHQLSASEAFGNTWGQEIVLRTFNFAAGSIGAAIGRNLVAVLDPNHHTKWLKDGKIDWQELAKSTGESAFRIMTYNQMEDWFAAPFYTIQLRLTRGMYHNGLDGNAAPDAAMWDLQDGGNGNARFFTENGELGNSLHGAGAVDFQSRFMLYNFYTLLFRDLYNHLGHKLNGQTEPDVSPCDTASTHPIEGLVTGMGENIKYLLKSLIKSQIYMAPSVLAFWPQNLAMQEHNHYLIDAKSGDFMTTQPSRPFDPKTDWNKPFVDENGIPFAHSGIAARADDIRAGNPLYRPGSDEAETLHRPFYHVNYDETHPLDPILNPIGKMGSAYSGFLKDHVTSKAVYLADLILEDEQVVNHFAKDAAWATDTFARAQLAYLPYMTAKYELAQLWDTPEMDASIYRVLDGFTHFNGGEIVAGLKDIGQVLTHNQVSDETKQATGKPRGLVNSLAESEQKTEETQAKLRRKHYYEKQQACKGDKDCVNQLEYQEILKPEGENNIVSFARKSPDSHVQHPEYDGKTREAHTGQLILH